MEVKYLGRHPSPGYHALKCEMYVRVYCLHRTLTSRRPNGTKLTVNCVMSDYRFMEDKQGAVITIRYSAMTKKGLPKWPYMDSIRTELDWEDVKREANV